MKINNEVQFEDLKSSDQVLIQMQNITKIFKTGAGDFTALDDVSLDFFKGEFVGIVGRSGSGKSTLANMITGIDHPTSGNIVIDNQVTNQKNENDMSIWRGRNLGIVFQFFQLLPTLTLLENVMLPMDFCNHNQASEREYQAVELLKLVGLENYVNKLPDMVSGGQ
ncbi:MAG: ABC transporter ATP-binding protein, partial [Anaerolineaceae bacterium]